MDNDNDDVPTLSAETLSALRQFLFERQALELYEQKLSSTITDEPDNFEENWNLSQFWVCVAIVIMLLFFCYCCCCCCDDVRSGRFQH
jgi:hypothetical protein